MHRRAFLKTSAAGLAFAAVPILPRRSIQRYRTVLIGTGWWGMNILREAMAAGHSEVVGLCDVDQRQLNDAYAEVEQLSGDQPTRYADYRDLIAETRPEIAIIATPDHWHALCTIAAIEAGAHVYVEKPISHTVDEGTAMLKAARAHERTVQVGTHRRASPHNISGMEFLKSGKVGDVGMVRMFVHYGGGPGEVTPDEEPPPELDWDLWLGPAPYRPFNPQIHPRGFRQFLDYANGQLGDWGIHWLDQLLWWSEEPWPKHIHSTGGRFIREDNTTAPDTQVVNYEFETFSAVWEHRLYAANNAETHNIGCYFYGTEGTFHMGWQDGWTFYPARKSQPLVHEDPQLNEPDGQNIRGLWADFLDAIETGRRPVCDIEVGYRATNMSLLGMLSWKLGRSVEWDGDRGVIVGDYEANQLLRRPYRAPWVYPG